MLNNFQEFYNDLTGEERKELARRAGTSPCQLYQLATFRRKAGADLGARLKAADNRITDAMLRPDLYGGK